MSALCIYGCGNYTNEPDDICARCKGFSSIKKVKTSHVESNIGADLSVRPGGEKVKEKDYKLHQKCV